LLFRVHDDQRWLLFCAFGFFCDVFVFSQLNFYTFSLREISWILATKKRSSTRQRMRVGASTRWVSGSMLGRGLNTIVESRALLAVAIALACDNCGPWDQQRGPPGEAAICSVLAVLAPWRDALVPGPGCWGHFVLVLSAKITSASPRLTIARVRAGFCG